MIQGDGGPLEGYFKVMDLKIKVKLVHFSIFLTFILEN
jgi:hypothetical protein